MLAQIVAVVFALVYFSGIGAMSVHDPIITVQPAPDIMSEEHEWSEYHAEAYADYSAQFTALFNSYETKWSKNGRLMLRTGDHGPYKFAKRAI